MNNGVAVNKAEQERSAEIAELKQAKAHAEKQMVNGELPAKKRPGKRPSVTMMCIMRADMVMYRTIIMTRSTSGSAPVSTS